MTLDLDALEALEKKATPGPWVAGIEGRFIHFPESYHATEYDYVMCALVRNALPELIRLARIGQKVEEEGMKRPDFLIQALNEGDGVYRP